MDSHTHTAQVERLEVVETGRRRRWSEEAKLKILLESLQVPRQVAATARRHGISRSQLLQWRRSFRDRPKGAAEPQIGFVPAMVVPDPAPAAPTGQAASGTIEIELASGARMRITGVRVRKEQSAPLLATLEAWLREQRARLSKSSAVAGPIDYMLRRWDRFARFIDDGRICLTNNAAERALRGFALGRKLFAGSERGADRAAVMATLIMTAKLNDIDPQAWLADVLARIAEHAAQRLDELLPWNWASSRAQPQTAA